MTKRLDTGSPWILANNSRAPYWNSLTSDPTNIKGHTGNSEYRLANLVRASTAAPHFFDPEILIISRTSASSRSPTSCQASGLPGLSLGQQAPPAAAEIAKSTKGQNIADTHGLFVDGGVTPFNNPAMALLMMTQPAGSS